MLWSQEATCTQGGGFWVSSASSPSPTCSSSCPPLVPEDEPLILFDDEVCLLRPRPLFSQCIRSSPSSTQQQESQIPVDPGDSQWTIKEDGDGNEPSYIQTGGISTCSRQGPRSGGVYVHEKVLVGPGCVSSAQAKTPEEEEIRFISQKGGRIAGPVGGTPSGRTLSEKSAGLKETPGPCMSRRAQSGRFTLVTGNPLNASQEPHHTPTLKCRGSRETPKQTSEGFPSASQQNCAWGLPPTAPWHRSPYIRRREASCSPRKIFCCPEREQGEEREEEKTEETRQKTSHDEQRGDDKEEEQAIMKHFDRSIFLSQTSDEGDTQEETPGLEKETQESMKCIENRGRYYREAESATELQGADYPQGREEKTWEMPRTPYKSSPAQDIHIHEEPEGQGQHIISRDACSFSPVNKDDEKKESTSFPSGPSVSGSCTGKRQVHTLVVSASRVSSPVSVPKVVTCSPSSSPRSCVIQSVPALSQLTGPSLSTSSSGGPIPIAGVHSRPEEIEVTGKVSSSPVGGTSANAIDLSSLSPDQPLSGSSRPSQHSACSMPSFSSGGVLSRIENSSSVGLPSAIFPISSSHSGSYASSVIVSSGPSLLSSVSSSSSSSSRTPASCLQASHVASSPPTSSWLASSSSHLASSDSGRGSQTTGNREQQTVGRKDHREDTSREEDLLFYTGDDDDEEEDDEDKKTEKADDEVEVGVIEEERKSSPVSSCSSSSSPSSRQLFFSSSTCPDSTKSSRGLLKGDGCRRRTSEALDDLDELINVDVDYLICSTQTPSSSSLADNSCLSSSSSSSSSISRSCSSPHRSTSSSTFPDDTEISSSSSSSSPSSSCRRVLKQGCHAEGSSSSLACPCPPPARPPPPPPPCRASSSTCCFTRQKDDVSLLSNAVEKDPQSEYQRKSLRPPLSSEAGVNRREEPVLLSSRRKDLSSSSSFSPSCITSSRCFSLPPHHTDSLSLPSSLNISSPKILPTEEPPRKNFNGCLQPPSAEAEGREIVDCHHHHHHHHHTSSPPPSLSYERVLSRGTPPFKRQTLTQNSPHASRQCLAPSRVCSPHTSCRSTRSSSSTHLRSSISSLTPNHLLLGGSRNGSSCTLHRTGNSSLLGGGPGGVERDRKGQLWGLHGGEIDGAVTRQESMAERKTERDPCLNWTPKKPSLSSQQAVPTSSCSYRVLPHGGAMACRVKSAVMQSSEKQQTFEDRRLRFSSSSRYSSRVSSVLAREGRLDEEKTKTVKERHASGDKGDYQQQITTENTSTLSFSESLEFNPDEEAFLQMMDEGNF